MFYFQVRTSRQLIDFPAAHCFAESVTALYSFQTVCLNCQFVPSHESILWLRVQMTLLAFSDNSLDNFLEMFLTSLRFQQQVLLKRHAVFVLHYLTFSLFIENVRNHLSKAVHHILEDQHPRLHRGKSHKSYNKSSVKSLFTSRYVVNFERIKTPEELLLNLLRHIYEEKKSYFTIKPSVFHCTSHFRKNKRLRPFMKWKT